MNRRLRVHSDKDVVVWIINIHTHRDRRRTFLIRSCYSANLRHSSFISIITYGNNRFLTFIQLIIVVLRNIQIHTYIVKTLNRKHFHTLSRGSSLHHLRVGNYTVKLSLNAFLSFNNQFLSCLCLHLSQVIGDLHLLFLFFCQGVWIGLSLSLLCCQLGL